MPDCGGHAAYLTIAPLGELQLDPTIGDRLPHPNGHRPRRQLGFGIETPRCSLAGALTLDDDTRTQRAECVIIGDALDLSPIRSRYMVARFGQRRSEPWIIAEHQQAFAIAIETASTPNAGQVDVVSQRGPRRIGSISELRQNVVRLPERDGGHGRLRVPLARFADGEAGERSNDAGDVGGDTDSGAPTLRGVSEAAQDVQWSSVLGGLVAGSDMDRDDARFVVSSVLAGQATDAQIGAFLAALASKGETTDELLGMRDAMFDASTPLDLPVEAIDIVGVGGAPRRQVAAFNVSTISSVVASAAGAIVCKHGNRRASSTSGSFDLLEALGCNIELPPDRIEAGVQSLGLGFAFARAHHPSMRHVGPARAQLGIPTVFNVLGPLAHPGRIGRQVLGVPDATRAQQIASVVAGADADVVWVVHGHENLDELALTGPSNVIEVRNGQVREFTVDPTDYGLARVATEDVLGGDAEVNAGLARSVLAGEASPNRDVVVLNAGAGLVVAGVATDLADGVTQAAAAIDDGRASTKLDEFVAFTNA